MEGFLKVLKRAVFFWESEKKISEIKMLESVSEDLKQEHERASSGFEKSLDDFRKALANRNQVTRAK